MQFIPDSIKIILFSHNSHLSIFEHSIQKSILHYSQAYNSNKSFKARKYLRIIKKINNKILPLLTFT